MIPAINSALSGLAASSKRLEASANSIAGQPASPDSSSAQKPPADPDKALITQNTASYDYKANLKTIKVADNMEKSLLNIIG